MTYAALKAVLAAAGVENSAGEARILLTELCGIAAADLPFCNIADADGRLDDAVARRARHEPLQYILGKWHFYKEEYFVSPDCLIPRADTELLVETLVADLPRGARLLDLCTGSGCIAISTAKNRPDITVLAADLSAGALTMAAKNAAANGVTTVDFARLDVTAPSPLDEVFDCIVSNPPYIRTDVVPTLAPELAYEPKMALDGGADGMDFYRAILTSYAQNLADGGAFLFEFGYDQEKDAAALAAAHRLGFAPLFDLGGRFRAARMTRQQRKV